MHFIFNKDMGSLSLRLKGRSKAGRGGDFYPIHDLRLYSPEELPSYINPERTHENRILYGGELPQTKEEAKEWVKRIEEENKKLFKEMKEKGYLAKNQGYKIASPLVAGILTLSHEAQKKLREEKLLGKFLEYAKEYLELLAKALGTDLLYAVVHLDETAPHIHFALRNISYKDPDPEAVRKLGWDDLLPKLEKAKGKAITNLYYSETSLNNITQPRDYQFHMSRLQDTLEFFKPLGLGRGTPKKERLARGEPYWKVVNRSVRRLHEDLPKEIKLAEEKVARLYYEIGELERRHDELMEEIRRLEEKRAKLQEVEKRLEEATAKVYELEKEKAKLMQEILVMQSGIKALEKTYSEWQRKSEELAKELQRTEEEIERKRKELEELRYTLRGYEGMIRDRQRKYEEYERLLEDKRKELERLLAEIQEKKEVLEVFVGAIMDLREVYKLKKALAQKKEELKRELDEPPPPRLGR